MIKSRQIKHKFNQAGDTIIEVMLAMAIAAFAIGVSYATAHRSLNQAISAREHTQALNIVENQISDLKQRALYTPTASFGNFKYPNTNFCLVDSATDATAANWQPQTNNGPGAPPSDSASLADKLGGGPYDQTCHIVNGGNDYFINIETSPKQSDLYHVTVRWERIGGGPVNSTSVYYKTDGGGLVSAGQTGGGPGGGCVVGCSSTTLTTNIAVMQYPGFDTPPNFVAWANGVQFISCTFQPDGSVTGCPNSINNVQTYDCSTPVPGTNFTSIAPLAAGGNWDPAEVCRAYSINWNIPIDPALLQYLDVQFVNDRFCYNHGETWCTGTYNGAQDNNILIYGFSLPGSYQVRMGSFANCTPLPIEPVPNSVISGTNVLALYWTNPNNIAYLYVSPNATGPDGTSDCNGP